MSRLSSLLLALPLLAATTVAPAAADESMACGKRNEMLGHLSGKYSEEPVAMGLATNGSLVEVLASSAGSSFTIVYTTPDGLTCMMAAGSNWETVKQQLADIKA
ncbi:MAG: hypothetical protein ABFS30_12680 [Pseudomonadota bacterium]